MLVSDLNYFLDLPPEAPGPARRLAGHLSNIVRAATAGDAGAAWECALPCRRRPASRRCPGRMIVLRTDAPAPIGWRCTTGGGAGPRQGRLAPSAGGGNGHGQARLPDRHWRVTET